MQAIYVMLCLLIHCLIAAMGKGRDFLVSELFISQIILQWFMMSVRALSSFVLIFLFILGSGCNLVSQCCNSYEYCVSCCQNPSRVWWASSWLVYCFILSLFSLLLPYEFEIESKNWRLSGCCLQTKREQILKIKIAKPTTAGND